jgi:hypothetical protein
MVGAYSGGQGQRGDGEGMTSRRVMRERRMATTFSWVR